ncbi:MAG: hypothetical protein Q7U28_18665 [Aquabacterium sp.]|nr:hypothetical protein [Aquabacterium sp.]
MASLAAADDEGDTTACRLGVVDLGVIRDDGDPCWMVRWPDAIAPHLPSKVHQGW